MYKETLINDYAKEKNVSLSNVYQKIKRGTLQSIKRNHQTFVIEEVEHDFKEVQKSSSKCKEKSKLLKQELKLLKKLLQSKEDEIDTLKKSFNVFHLTLQSKFKELENNVIDADIEIKKKKKK